jgi:hypothetical protein
MKKKETPEPVPALYRETPEPPPPRLIFEANLLAQRDVWADEMKVLQKYSGSGERDVAVIVLRRCITELEKVCQHCGRP